MEVQQIIRNLDEEIERLREARALLAGEAHGRSRSGKSSRAAGKSNRLSEEGRRRISAALKRRWAARRKAVANSKKG